MEFQLRNRVQAPELTASTIGGGTAPCNPSQRSVRRPAGHWSKLRSTNPLERFNKEIGRRTDVVGIFPNDAALIRLAGMLLIEQSDEWLVSRRYLSQESLSAVLDMAEDTHKDIKEVPALSAA